MQLFRLNLQIKVNRLQHQNKVWWRQSNGRPNHQSEWESQPEGGGESYTVVSEQLPLTKCLQNQGADCGLWEATRQDLYPPQTQTPLFKYLRVHISEDLTWFLQKKPLNQRGTAAPFITSNGCRKSISENILYYFSLLSGNITAWYGAPSRTAR